MIGILSVQDKGENLKLILNCNCRNDSPLICLHDRKITIQLDNAHNMIAQYDYQTIEKSISFYLRSFQSYNPIYFSEIPYVTIGRVI